jgi:hypothetical protein
MAWLSLFIVVIVFFIPEFGLSQFILSQDVRTNVSFGKINFAISIPLTGPLKLLLLVGVIWFALWIILYLLTTKVSKISTWLQPFFRISIVPIHPKISLLIPFLLARIVVILSGIEGFIFIASKILAALASAMVLGSSLFVNDLVSVLANIFSKASGFLEQYSSNWTLIIFILSVLVLIVEKVTRWEKKKLIQIFYLCIQKDIKKQQKTIAIPAEQL